MTNRRAELMLIAVAVVASAGWVMSKLALEEFEAYTFVAIRFLLASLTLAMLCIPDLKRLSINQIGRSLATGATMGLGLLAWVVALQMTDNVGEGAFIASLAVIAVPIIGWLIFGDKITAILLVSLVPALAGLYFLAKDNMVSGGVFSLGVPQLLFLGSSIAFATHLNLSSHFVKNIPPLALATVQLAMPGIMACIGVLLVGSPLSEQGIDDISTNGWLLLLGSALLATSMRFSMQVRALQHLNPTHASMILLAEPVFTAMLGAWWLKERMTGNQLLGCALIFSGLLCYRGAPLLRQYFR